jgi:lysophospholipase L1-like esterase
MRRSGLALSILTVAVITMSGAMPAAAVGKRATPNPLGPHVMMGLPKKSMASSTSGLDTTTGPLIVANNAASGDGPIQTYDFGTGGIVNSFVPDGAASNNNGRAVAVVGNKVFYSELGGGFGPSDAIHIAPFNGGAGGSDIGTLPSPAPSVGIQDLDYANGALYALTGYPAGSLQAWKLDPTTGAVLAGPIAISSDPDADGFTVLPDGNFLINSGDASCAYAEYNSATGTPTGSSITVPGAATCTGVATDGSSLYFQTGFSGFTKTDLVGNFISQTTVPNNLAEDISLVNSSVQTTRYVALGDSVPYGHGLANPSPDPQIGLGSAVSQGPSDQAYPALVAKALNLNLNIRNSDCTLTGDDLTISGAKAAQTNTQSGSDQCKSWPDNQSVETDELPAAQLAQDPAKLVTIQAGADDINFGDCITFDLSKTVIFGLDFHSGTQCVKDNAVTPELAAKLANVRDALAKEIVQAAPHAKHIAVLNYYQIIPKPTDFKNSSITRGKQTDPLCSFLAPNLKDAYHDAAIVQSALNVAITSAVVLAQGDGVSNVQLIDLSNLEATHEMCTGNPALFSGELMPTSQFSHDVAVIKSCPLPIHLKSCQTDEPAAERDLRAHLWRAAHPNTFGQQDIARAVEAQLGNL